MSRKKTTKPCEDEPAAAPALRSPSNIPTVSADGRFMAQAGKYARGATLAVFQMIGGTRRMAEWADENPGEYYTKIFAKLVKPEAQVVAEDDDDVEALLRKLGRTVVDAGDLTADEEDDGD